jgi:hypothetical protein
LLFLPLASAETTSLSLPDAPSAVSGQRPIELADLAIRDLPDAPDLQDSASPAPVLQPAPAQASDAQTPAPVDKKKQAQEELQKEEHQRILGIMPAFNSVNNGVAAPLTPKQKFQLMYKSTTDPYVFAFAAFTAGIGQAQDSHAAYGQGAEGYAKRFGANYADTADGNLWGNAILPVVLHEDPRYFRLGQGTFKHRLLYSMSTAVICRRDDGSRGPNYANVAGNLIAGGISNIYYPSEDRGVGQTLQSAATVTAEGMIGAALIEFWPDIANHYRQKKLAKLDAAAHATQGNSVPEKPTR